jgi:hypothetical protein
MARALVIDIARLKCHQVSLPQNLFLQHKTYVQSVAIQPTLFQVEDSTFNSTWKPPTHSPSCPSK